jgi:hypothetical protein
MRPSLLRRSSFLLAFSAAVGILSSLALVALAGAGSSISGREKAPAQASDVFAAFDRARAPADVLPAEAERALTELPASAPRSDLDPGRIVVGESRRVVGPGERVVYLAPTTKDNVCFVGPEPGHAGCSNGSRVASDGVELSLSDADGLGLGEPTVLSGFLAPDVVSVDVSVKGGRRLGAAVANGLFYATSTSVPVALVVTFRDGTERAIPIPAPPET